MFLTLGHGVVLTNFECNLQMDQIGQCLPLVSLPSRTRKYHTRLYKYESDKQSSLFGPFISYKAKKFCEYGSKYYKI
jgi:hypothetical protein